MNDHSINVQEAPVNRITVILICFIDLGLVLLNWYQYQNLWMTTIYACALYFISFFGLWHAAQEVYWLTREMRQAILSEEEWSYQYACDLSLDADGYFQLPVPFTKNFRRISDLRVARKLKLREPPF